MDLELPTGFEAAQHAYQSAAHAILGQDVAGDGLFVELTGIEILYRASASLGFSQGSFLQALVAILSWCLAINSCMGVLLRIRMHFSKPAEKQSIPCLGEVNPWNCKKAAIQCPDDRHQNSERDELAP